MDILILKMPKIYLNFFEIRYSQVIKYLRLIKEENKNFYRINQIHLSNITNDLNLKVSKLQP